MHRIPANPRKDAQYFSRTAASTKAVNVKPTNYRGGIRF